MNDIVNSFVEVKLKNSEDFLKVKETLTRLGLANTITKTLYQSCHILHKRGSYYIVHFKELFALDGKPSTMSDDDRARRNRIAKMLSEWNLVDLIKDIDEDDCVPASSIKVLSFKDSKDWSLIEKYNIGGKSNKARQSHGQEALAWSQ